MFALERREYPNGLVAIADPLPGRKAAFLDLCINVGSKDEPASKKGAAHLLEHMMFRSNSKYTYRRLHKMFEYRGIIVSASCGYSKTHVSFEFPPQHIDTAVKIAHLVFSDTRYFPDEFAMEKEKVIKDELVADERDSHSRFGDLLLYPHVFGVPFGLPIQGTLESASSLTLDDLVQRKKAYYVPNNAAISVSGSVDPSHFFRLVGESFGKLEPQPVKRTYGNWDYSPGVIYEEFFDLEDPKDEAKDHAKMSIAFPVNGPDSKDWLSLKLLETILGSGFTSLMFVEGRLKRGLSYEPTADYVSLDGRAAMILSFETLHPSNIDEARDVTLSIVSLVKNGKISRDYFRGKKGHLNGLLTVAEDDLEYRARSLSEEALDNDRYSIGSLTSKIRRLTLREFVDVSQRNLSMAPLTIVASAPGYVNSLSRAA